ncbi:MAG: hypothetical protein DHS20C15_11920 [Planctomycetota bacterium]|nr:MAG: hypothetical protein DHS20C15_11920 [Planctomycetota bacterium]
MSSWWDRVADLVERARALPEGEREAFLEEACAGDESLRRDAAMVLGSDAPDEFLEPAEHVLPAGHELGGFTLLRPVGRGGMGVVYLARQAGLREAAALEERLAAVKVFPRTRERDPQGYERFLREAEAATSLQHAGLVGVLASGESEGVAWYAMPYIEGHDLHVELERQRSVLAGAEPTGPLILPPHGSERYVTEVVERIADVADAVDYVHRRGVIHRDLKPRNLLLDRAGTLRIADFGLAKILSMATLTATNQNLGTPYYMSPEQARAIKNPVDERSDIYSLGVVLFEMLSLKNHVVGRSAEEIIRNIATGATLRLGQEAPRTPRDLVVICEKALSVRPADRYPTASALAADLRHVLHREAIDARPPTTWQRARNWTLRHPVAVVATGLVLIALFGGAWWSSYNVQQQRVDDWSARLEAALALDDWRGAEALAADARFAVNDMRARGEVPYELAELVGRFDARLAQDKQDRVASAQEHIARGKGGPIAGTGAEPYIAPPYPPAIVEGLLEASQALSVHPADPELSALTLFAVPLRIELADFAPHAGASGPARAYGWQLDPVREEYGPRRDFGELPVELALPPGDWRFAVELPGVGFSEYDRDFALGFDPEPIVARVHAEADVTTGCVLLPAATLTLDEPRELGCTLVKREVDVAPVWFRETEVSNGEYLEFLRDTQRRAPSGWREVGYPDGDDVDHDTAWRALPGVDDFEQFARLPMVALGDADAVAYAEWAGLRLPTHHELEYALRGAEMRRTPPAGAHIDGQDTSPVMGAAAHWQQYLTEALPVASGQRLAPHGLFHIFGNVRELTSSKASVRVQGGRRLVTFDRDRIEMGGAWDARATSDELYDHWLSEISETRVDYQAGLRCVRSAALPNN